MQQITASVQVSYQHRQNDGVLLFIWVVLKHLIFLETLVEHKPKEVFRSDLVLVFVFCSSLFSFTICLAKHRFNKMSDACIDY